MDVTMCKRCITNYHMDLPTLWWVGVCDCCDNAGSTAPGQIVYNITYEYIDKFNKEA